ncbi:MAG: electron transfer flavoprotein subunit beta/FixA family protein [Desulfobacteraceae bacterium]|uniref:Electron transfer flavoprotein subunit beta/FixA family protein n=1 Tax=Candidatus Desulfacyla euxinica TaxID=2841693 RepID=A0A8J6N1X1_9DELT|nr:electron transfer flavoprotein subunit beta/FixA family protein [Candidatus Desulfacyla euxinica]MBL6978392.1 electron transfer flavoprotein subunit beta/FixA family protein [Desulfobacteraceae bacterium]
MHIIVCIKSVIVKAPEAGMVRSHDSTELNPFDRPVLETALRIKEARGGITTALSMGPESSISVLSEARAMGLDRGVLACDPALAGSDTLATSTALAAAIDKLRPFDLVLFGTRTSDSDTGQVGPQAALLLGIPLVTQVHSIEYIDSGLYVERTVDGFIEKFELSFPAALTIHPASVQPRDIDLADIGPAFEKQDTKIWNLGDLELSPDQVGDAGSPTKVLSISKSKRHKRCEFIKGDTLEQADELIKRLAESGMIG